MSGTIIKIVHGGITEQLVDGVMTFVSPLPNWNGPVDQAIRNHLGTSFHDRLKEQAGKGFFNTTGQILIVKGKPHEKSVVFVCDDPNVFKPLHEVLAKAIELSLMCNIRSFALPILRQGAAFSRLMGGGSPYYAEKTLIEVLQAFEYPVEIVVVVNNEPSQVERLYGYLAK